MARSSNSETDTPIPSRLDWASHFGKLMREMDRRYTERFEASAEAIKKAELAADKRFEALNELRQVVTDTLNKAMPRHEAEAAFALIREKLTDIVTADTNARAELASRLSVGGASLQDLIKSSVDGMELRLAQAMTETGKRISAIELALSEGKGKQAVADPAFAELTQMVRTLKEQSTERRGRDTVSDPALAALMKEFTEVKTAVTDHASQGKGAKSLTLGIIGAMSFIATILGIANFFKPAVANVVAPTSMAAPK